MLQDGAIHIKHTHAYDCTTFTAYCNVCGMSDENAGFRSQNSDMPQQRALCNIGPNLITCSDMTNLFAVNASSIKLLSTSHTALELSMRTNRVSFCVA